MKRTYRFELTYGKPGGGETTWRCDTIDELRDIVEHIEGGGGPDEVR
jgi:hypothetical protein